MGWKVKLTAKAERELRYLLNSRIISQEDLKVLLRWVDEMEEYGPTFIADSREWYDHSLDGNWRGFRSSAFSSKGRVIYRIEDKQVIVEVHRVTADHNYRR